MTATDRLHAIHLRGVPESVFQAFRRGAAARGLSQTEYLARLLELHRLCLKHPGVVNTSVTKWIRELGLEEVTA